MTRRKPLDVSFEAWTDRLVREAQERGEFDDLPGAGKPIPDLDRPWSAERWAVDWARREGVDLSETLPPSLRLRRQRERLLAAMGGLAREGDVRALVEQFNAEVREAFRRPVTGPPMTVGLLDLDAVLIRWRAERAELADARNAENAETVAQDAGHTETGAQARRRWWQRRS